MTLLFIIMFAAIVFGLGYLDILLEIYDKVYNKIYGIKDRTK